MGERSDQITGQIERTRGGLGDNLQELEHKVKDATDWRKQFQKSPLMMIGLAFGGGILLSRVIGGSSHSRRRYSRPDGDDGRSADAGTRYEKQKAADTWDNIKGALIGVAASKAQDYLRAAIPGFREEYSKIEHHKGSERFEEATSHAENMTPKGL